MSQLPGIRHLPGLSRIDTATTHGYLARYYAPGETLTAFFSDSRAGGGTPAGAEEAGLRWLLAHSARYPVRVRFQRGKEVCVRWKQERARPHVLVVDVRYTRGRTRKTKSFRVHRYESLAAALAEARLFRATQERRMSTEARAAKRLTWQVALCRV